MTSRLARSLVACCLLAACHKANEPVASGPLATEDLALLRDLPGGNLALFGGNYLKLQDFMSSTAGKLARRAFDKMADKGEGMAKWMGCFTELKKVRLVGSVANGPEGMQMRLAFTGMTVADVAGCAQRAGFPSTVDADGKYIGLEVPGVAGKTNASGYLLLADGALYFRQTFQLGMVPTAMPSTRADLEADAAAAQKGSAADDKKLVGLAAKTDRRRTVWFAGSAAGTPIGGKLGELYGSVDIADGVAIDVVAQITDSSLASTIEDQFRQMKKQADRLPADLRPVIENLELDRNGDRLRFGAKITNEQLTSIMKLSGMGRSF